MKMKFLNLKNKSYSIFILFLFFFLLKLNQSSYEYNLIGKSGGLIEYVSGYLDIFFKKLSFLDFLIFILLIIPGVIILKSDTNYTNITILLFYIFFFTPFFLFFFKFDIDFFKTLTNKAISISQLDLYLLSFFLYLNLYLLIYFSHLKLSFNIKRFIIKKKTIKLACILFILLLLFYLVVKIYHLEEFNFNSISISDLKLIGLRSLLTGSFGYLYYISIFFVIPLYYLIDKKNYDLIFITLIYLILFIFFKTKINLILMVLLVLWSQISLFKSKILMSNILKLILYFLLFVFIISIFLNYKYQIVTSLYFERLFLSQTKNLFFIYDFINLNKPIYLTHISLLNNFYPYEKNFYLLIKSIYGGGMPTSNSYIMDGLASFGLIGLFFSTIMISLILKVIDNLTNFNHSKFKLIYFFQIIGFLSFPLSVQFFTYGLGLTIFLSMIEIKK